MFSEVFAEVSRNFNDRLRANSSPVGSETSRSSDATSDLLPETNGKKAPNAYRLHVYIGLHSYLVIRFMYASTYTAFIHNNEFLEQCIYVNLYNYKIVRIAGVFGG